MERLRTRDQQALRQVVVLTETIPATGCPGAADSFVDAFLFVGRFVEPRVLGHMERTSAAVAYEYRCCEGRSSDIQVTFTMIFVVVLCCCCSPRSGSA